MRNWRSSTVRWHRGFEPRWARGRIFAADDRVSAEIVDAVKGKVPVLIDGGIRRGTDVSRHWQWVRRRLASAAYAWDWRRLDSQASKRACHHAARTGNHHAAGGNPVGRRHNQGVCHDPILTVAGKQTTDEKKPPAYAGGLLGEDALTSAAVGPRSTSWWSKQAAPDCSSGG